jgi:hypothetical protein
LQPKEEVYMPHHYSKSDVQYNIISMSGTLVTTLDSTPKVSQDIDYIETSPSATPALCNPIVMKKEYTFHEYYPSSSPLPITKSIHDSEATMNDTGVYVGSPANDPELFDKTPRYLRRHTFFESKNNNICYDKDESRAINQTLLPTIVSSS